MKLFVLTSRIPYPLEKGDKLRIFNQLKGLSISHDIYLCSLHWPNSSIPNKAYKVLSKFCKEVHFIQLSYFQIFWSVTKSLFNNTPFQTALFYDRIAHNKINHLILNIKPNHIYCQLTRVAKYIVNQKTPKTLDFMDAFSIGMKRRADRSIFFKKIFYNWEAKKQKKFESLMLDLFDKHIIITKQDQSFIHNPSNQEIKIIRNGVDFNYFKPMKKKYEYDIVFVGNMGYTPNIDAVKFLCKEILPLIQNKYPCTKVLVAGTNPTKEILNLSSENISISGWMDDIRKAYLLSKILIAPMRMGSGLQNKLLEAMAMKKPCITTNIVNNSLNAPNNTVLVGETANELANHCIKLIKDENYRLTISENGFSFVKKNYCWIKSNNKLKELIEN